MARDDDLRHRVAGMVHDATSGTIPVADALDGTASLHELGLDSLGWLRLIDAIEITYGVELDLRDTSQGLTTVDAIADRLSSDLGRNEAVVEAGD